jgi:hypothetical protein
MFGGAQIGWEFPLGDLWRFNLATRRWTFMAGLPDQTYGSRFSQDEQAFHPDWLPGATYSGALWTDRDGYIWLREGQSGSSWASKDVWSFSTLKSQWGRIKGSYLYIKEAVYANGIRYFPSPGYTTGSIVFTKSSDASMAYFLHGLGYSTTPSVYTQFIAEIWRISTAVTSTPIPPAPKLPIIPSGNVQGLQAKWIQLGGCATPPTLSSLTSAAAAVTTTETGYLLRYEFGNSLRSMAPPQINRATCFAAQFTGYLWNPSPTLIPFRFLIHADSGVQLEWSTPGNFVLQTSSWWNTTAQPFEPHTNLPFYSGSYFKKAYPSIKLDHCDLFVVQRRFYMLLELPGSASATTKLEVEALHF